MSQLRNRNKPGEFQGVIRATSSYFQSLCGACPTGHAMSY